jgi:hypothetical protein
VWKKGKYQARQLWNSMDTPTNQKQTPTILFPGSHKRFRKAFRRAEYKLFNRKFVLLVPDLFFYPMEDKTSNQDHKNRPLDDVLGDLQAPVYFSITNVFFLEQVDDVR